MPKLITETFTEKLPFEAGAVKSVKLPTVGYVTRYELLFKLNVTTDATNGGIPNEDAIARIIQSLRIEQPGGKVYYGVPDGRLIKYMNYVVFAGQIREDSLPTAAGVTQDVYAKYILFWGLNPADPFDPTAVIPAEELSDLLLTITWGSASDLGIGYTINSGEVEITARYIVPEEGEDISQIFPLGYNQPVFTPVELDIAEIKTDMQIKSDLPTGNVLRHTLIMVLDSAGNKSNNDITEVGIIKPRERTTLFKQSWLSLNAVLRHDYGLPSDVAGIGIIDYEDVSGVPIGLDLTEVEEGVYKIGFSSAATGGKIKMVHVQIT